MYFMFLNIVIDCIWYVLDKYKLVKFMYECYFICSKK